MSNDGAGNIIQCNPAVHIGYFYFAVDAFDNNVSAIHGLEIETRLRGHLDIQVHKTRERLRGDRYDIVRFFDNKSAGRPVDSSQAAGIGRSRPTVVSAAGAALNNDVVAAVRLDGDAALDQVDLQKARPGWIAPRYCDAVSIRVL